MDVWRSVLFYFSNNLGYFLISRIVRGEASGNYTWSELLIIVSIS